VTVVQATAARLTARRWPWTLVLIGAMLLPLYAFFTWTGQCVDMVAGAGDSYCTTSPSIGWPGAWLLTAVGAVAFVVSLIQLVRLSLTRGSRTSI
jgi:hypothetical protein